MLKDAFRRSGASHGYRIGRGAAGRGHPPARTSSFGWQSVYSWGVERERDTSAGRRYRADGWCGWTQVGPQERKTTPERRSEGPVGLGRRRSTRRARVVRTEVIGCAVKTAGSKIVCGLDAITSDITGPPRLMSHCQKARIGGSGACHCHPHTLGQLRTVTSVSTVVPNRTTQ